MSNKQTNQMHSLKNSRLTAAMLLAIIAVIIATLSMGSDAPTRKWVVTAQAVLAGEIATAISDVSSALDQARDLQDNATHHLAPIRIGVLAHKGTDICKEMWQPTMDYLNKTILGSKFDLVPLKFEEIEPAVRNKSIDFLICNPAIYVDLEVRYGVTRTMTLRNLVGTQIVSEFGGVVFCRADRSDIQSLRDARGQRLAATGQTSFGGWYMALREFRSAGIDPERDCARLIFLENHPAVVHKVLSGEADIGTVRTDTIERMAANGEIRMDEIRVIPADATTGSRFPFPYLHSTRLYPEWPFAKRSDTNDELSRKVTVALLTMPAGSPAAIAAQSGGWDICLDYTSVHECLRELRMPPYEHYGQLSWMDFCRQYWPWLAVIAGLIVALSGALMLLNGRQLAVKRISGQLRMLFASAGEGICAVDIDGITTFVNPAANKILGYTTDELLGKNLHNLTHHTKPDGRPYLNHECPIHLACKDGTVHQGSDEFFYHKNGAVIPISYSSRPIVDKGKINGAVICFRDITQRKQAETALAAKTRILEIIFQNAPYIMMLVNTEIRVTDINRKGVQFTGKSTDELHGLLCGQVFECLNSIGGRECGQNDDCEFCSVRSQVMYTFETGEPVYEGRGRLGVISNGVSITLDILISTTLIQLAGGRQVLVTIADITDRVRALEALRESEDKFRLTFSFSPDAVNINRLDDGLFVDINEGFTRLTGFTREDVIGRTSLEINIWHDPADRQKLIQGLLEKGFYENLEAPFRGKGGILISALMSARVILLKGVPHIISITRDITERKLIEASLLQAQKMESIGSLAGGIAHDLNNILFPISGLSEMLLDEIPPENPAHESIEQIHKSAQRGSDLVKQILAFSRQGSPQKLPIRIQPILKEALKLVRAAIPMNIEISSDINTDCGIVSADPTQLHQIAMNLITNAFHAVEQTGGTINISLKEIAIGSFAEKEDLPFQAIPGDLMSGRYACIAVSDTGTGIDQTLIDKIFDPYFTTKELGKGTGLGLSVVHGIIKEHGGEIQVYSEVGKGTVFHVYLPLLENARDSKAAAVTRKYPTGCERILLVDDEEPIVLLEQMMLEKLGYLVTVRTSSPDALAAFKANPGNFDLVISDRSMPNMTGDQLAGDLISIRPGIPIILCTGFSNENDVKRAKAMGVKGFLMKPVAIGDLAATVRKVLDDVADRVSAHGSGQADAIIRADNQ